MAKIYKKTDRIPIKIDDITVVISPLGIHEKTEAQQLVGMGRVKGDLKTATQGLIVVLKNAVKDIKGVTNIDGTPFKLEFENNVLTDSCIDDLFNMEIQEKLLLVCAKLIGSFPNKFTDENGNPLEGVEILPLESKGSEVPN